MSIPHDESTPSNETRRSMLRRAATLGAALGVAGAVTSATAAEAADGDPLVLGTTNTHNAVTNVNYGGPTVAASVNIQAGDQTAANDGILNGLFANAGTALLGVASGNGNQGIGIIGWSKKPGRDRAGRLHRGRRRLRRRVLRRPRRGPPAPRRQPADRPRRHAPGR